jgi:hypothetical protein
MAISRQDVTEPDGSKWVNAEYVDTVVPLLYAVRYYTDMVDEFGLTSLWAKEAQEQLAQALHTYDELTSPITKVY